MKIKNVLYTTSLSKIGDLIKITFIDYNDIEIHNEYLSFNISECFGYQSYNFLRALFKDEDEFYTVIERIGYDSNDIVNLINKHGYYYMKTIKEIKFDKTKKFQYYHQLDIYEK